MSTTEIYYLVFFSVVFNAADGFLCSNGKQLEFQDFALELQFYIDSDCKGNSHEAVQRWTYLLLPNLELMSTTNLRRDRHVRRSQTSVVHTSDSSVFDFHKLRLGLSRFFDARDTQSRMCQGLVFPLTSNVNLIKNRLKQVEVPNPLEPLERTRSLSGALDALNLSTIGWTTGAYYQGKSVARIILIATNKAPVVAGTFIERPKFNIYSNEDQCSRSDGPTKDDIQQVLENKRAHLIVAVDKNVKVMDQWNSLNSNSRRRIIAYNSIETKEQVQSMLEVALCDLSITAARTLSSSSFSSFSSSSSTPSPPSDSHSNTTTIPMNGFSQNKTVVVMNTFETLGIAVGVFAAVGIVCAAAVFICCRSSSNVMDEVALGESSLTQKTKTDVK